MKLLIALAALFSIALVGCNKDEVTPQETPATVTAAPVGQKGAGPQGGGAQSGMMPAPPGVKTGTP